MKHNPHLRTEVEAVARELAELIVETGFWDTTYANIPLLKNHYGVKVAIVDVNDMYDMSEDKGMGLPNVLNREYTI